MRLSRWHLVAIGMLLLAALRRWLHADHPSRQREADTPAAVRSSRHTDYSTDHAAFRLWIDSAIDWLPLPRVLNALILGVFIYIGGLLISLPFGFQRIYVSTLAVALGAFGFSLVLFVGSVGHRYAHASYEHLRPVFTVSDAQYKTMLTKWFARLADKRGILWATAAVFAFGCAVVAINYGGTPHFRQSLHLKSLRPSSYPSEWFTEQNIWPAVLVQLYYAAACAAAMGTAARMLVINLSLALHLRSVPIIPAPTLVRARLRQVTGLYIRMSLGWTLGVLLFWILFRGSYDPWSISFLSGLFLLGLLQLAMPQWVFRRVIYNSYDRLCALALRRFYTLTTVALEERAPRIGALDGGGDALRDLNLAELAELTAQPKTWIYDGRDVALWFGGQSVAITLVLLQAALLPAR